MGPFARFAAALSSNLRDLAQNERGSIGVMFGAIVVVVVMFIGASVDLGKAFMARDGIQDALDSAALAAGREIEIGAEKADAETKAREVFAANLPAGLQDAELTMVEIDQDSGQVILRAATTLQTSFVRIAGINELDIDAEAMVNTSGGSFEVALVLDGSGSMKGVHIEALKSASHALVAAMFGDKSVSNNIKMGIVPFTALVNVGADNRNADWIDSDGDSSVHYENMSEPVSRFALLDRMRNVSWAGCVEVRPGDHGITDSPADASDPDSLFVPSFAPDEPDNVNAGSSRYYNNYIADDGGTCTSDPPVCVRQDWRGRCIQYRTATLDPAVAQSRVCKYDNVAVNEAQSGGTIVGPNHMCDGQPITGLTNDRATIDGAIDALTAYGGTNIAEGVMWGWRLLSPEAPFDEGRPRNFPNNTKIMVVMSDGANQLIGLNNHNNSYYSAWGFGSTKRLNPNSQTTQSLSNSMDEKTNHACQNTKKDGIVVYSIAYNMNNHPSTRALLKRCASHPDKFFEAGSEADLIKAFEAIGLDLNSLRISS